MPVLVNINTATREELIGLPRVGRALADRIISYRDRVGGFRSIEELENVDGLPARVIRELRSEVTIDDDAGAGESKAKLVVVFDREGVEGDYTGFAIVVSGNRIVDDESVPFAVNWPAESGGESTVIIPDRAHLTGEIRIDVLAPDGARAARETRAAASLPGQITIDVAPRKVGTTQANNDPAAGKPTRVRGRVIDEDGKNVPPETQVVLWGATADDPEDADFAALVVSFTDAKGHFSGPYPVGEFTRAHAAISIGEAPLQVPVHLVDGEFPESVILVIEIPEAGFSDEEPCPGKLAPPRSPDSTELARDDGMFSSDVGAGRCVDFTKPDRTLEEFSYVWAVRTTEPQIRGFTLEEPPKIDLGRLKDLVQNIPRERVMADTTAGTSDTPAAGIEGLKVEARVLRTLTRDPDGFSLTTLARSAHLSRHKDFRRALGRVMVKRPPTRENLSCSNVVDWDDEPTIYQACTIAHGHLLRFKQEWVADGYSMGNLLYSLPLAPGQKKQISVLDWERRETATRVEQLEAREDLDAFLQRDRDVSEVVQGTIRESSRGGSKSSSGSFAGGLGIGAVLGPVGALIGIGGGKSSAKSSAWQRSSRQTSASALNQLRDRTIQSASAVRSQRSTVVQSLRQGERVQATTESVANYNHCHAITIQYFEVLRHLLVRQRLVDVQECLFVPLMMSWFDSDKALRWRDTMFYAVPRKLRRGFGALDRIANSYAGSDLPTGRYADDQLLTISGDLRLRFQIARPRDTESGDFDAVQWNPLLKLFGFSPEDFYHQHLKDQQFKDRIFLDRLGAKIASTVVRRLRIHALLHNGSAADLKVDPTLISTFVNDRELYVSLRMAEDLGPVDRAQIKAVVISSRLQLPGLPFVIDALPSGSRVIVESGALRYTTAHHADYLFRDRRIDNDLTASDDVRIETPLNRRELRNPREEDKESSRRLLDYLNEHIERFHHVIWSRMSPDRRYMLLDGFQAPNTGGRSVASVVENELVGIVGNCLVLPVARGYHLDPTFNQDEDDPIDLLEHYEPNTPIEPMRVALPSRGVYAEAVMGACNSCEVKDETRFWRWEESPIPDSPPPIGILSTDTRRAAPPDLEAKDFASPIVAMQQAPAAPDPSGVAGVLKLLGQSGIFRDMAGLEGTQKAAAAALDAAFKTATTFGTKAADLALQGAMVKDVDKAMKTIETARKQGLINDKQASKLTESAISGLIGAGTTNPPKATSNDEVEGLTRTAGKNKAALKISRPTGEQIEVDAKTDDAGVAGAIADLFGLGGGGQPKPRPDRTRDLPLAIAKLNQFKAKPGQGAWTGLDRGDVADGLIDLVSDPDKVKQGSLGVCGAAVFFNVWIEADPLAFVKYATALYDKGEAQIGTLEIEAGSDLRAKDYNQVVPNMDVVVPPADWMVLSALRDSENLIFDYEGTPQEDFSGGTSASEIASWLRATGLFRTVKDESSAILGDDLAHAKTLNPTANRKVILFMDTNMILDSKPKGKSRHFVTLRSKVSEIAGGHVDFKFWTWGRPTEQVKQPLTKARFESTYLGAVIAEF